MAGFVQHITDFVQVRVRLGELPHFLEVVRFPPIQRAIGLAQTFRSAIPHDAHLKGVRQPQPRWRYSGICEQDD